MSNAASFPGEQPLVKPEGPEIVLIAALAERNRVIGRGMELPWHLPEDLRRFKRLTLGHPLVMGRRTFESLVHQFGGPLPGRRNVVVSTGAAWPQYPEVEVYRSLREALAALEDEPRIFIGGGGTVYAQCLPLADRLELTLVAGDYTGDAFFPPYEHLVGPVFEKVAEDRRSGFRFVTYRRRDAAARPVSQRA
ncbi:dihydrofolate reductase [Rhodocaloribacter litoris]|uniref:dihydrofolate reductase n=1 Tax=Rhodocaloribacter litoris TaxID=2558931 RepID=UPI001424A2F2|nr:dihydrofolate reductase [Rhodocaloribacter litoris]QXD15081.1 dihydrofolate reductase [Rhodocaloribacter litoris]